MDATRRPGEDGRGLLRATAGLLALDLVGGGLAVASGWNTPAEAWSGAAVLAAPLPMMAAQAVLAWTAARRSDRRAAAAAGLLAGACLVSGISGFFDGQFAREGLPPTLVAFQAVLVASTLGVGLVAGGRLRRLLHH